MTDEKKKAVRLLKTAKGQMEGIIKMIEDDRYCIDIANQLMATQALIKKADVNILQGHIKNCVADAFDSNDLNERNAKVEEFNNVLDKLLSK